MCEERRECERRREERESGGGKEVKERRGERERNRRGVLRIIYSLFENGCVFFISMHPQPPNFMATHTKIHQCAVLGGRGGGGREGKGEMKILWIPSVSPPTPHLPEERGRYEGVGGGAGSQ